MADPDLSSRAASSLFAVFGLCGGLLVVGLWWGGPYLPMTDLPQHVAQIGLWQQFDVSPGLDSQYRMNWATPYLLGYMISRGFAVWLGPQSGVRLTVTLALIAFPLALLLLQRARQRDPWWSLLGFPLAFGFAFYWGFLNYLVALPVSILFVGCLVAYLDRSNWRHRVALSLCSLLLLASHLLAWLFLTAVAIAVTLRANLKNDSLRQQMSRLLPLAAPLPLVGIWFLESFGSSNLGENPTVWDLGPQRLLGLPSLLSGPDLLSIGSTLAMGATLVTLLILVGAKGWQSRPTVGLVLALGLYLTLPREAFGLDFIYPRFAVLLTPWFVLAVPSIEGRRRRTLTRSILALTALGWLVVGALRLQAFGAEASSFTAIGSSIQPGDVVLSVVPDPTSGVVPGVPYAHFGAWLQVERQADPVFSFTDLPQMLVVRRDRVLDATPALAWYDPELTWKHAPHADWILLRRPASEDLHHAERRGSLSVRSGDWWLFEEDPPIDDSPRSRE